MLTGPQCQKSTWEKNWSKRASSSRNPPCLVVINHTRGDGASHSTQVITTHVVTGRILLAALAALAVVTEGCVTKRGCCRHISFFLTTCLLFVAPNKTRVGNRATKNHPIRPSLLLFKSGDPMKSEGPGHEELLWYERKTENMLV